VYGRSWKSDCPQKTPQHMSFKADSVASIGVKKSEPFWR